MGNRKKDSHTILQHISAFFTKGVCCSLVVLLCLCEGVWDWGLRSGIIYLLL